MSVSLVFMRDASESQNNWTLLWHVEEDDLVTFVKEKICEKIRVMIIWKLPETFQYECGATLQEHLFLSLFLSFVTAITLCSLIAYKG